MPDKLRIKNKHHEPIMVIIEPWAHEYSLKPSSTLEITANDQGYEDIIEVHYYPNEILVHTWSMDIIVLLDGQNAIPFEHVNDA